MNLRAVLLLPILLLGMTVPEPTPVIFPEWSVSPDTLIDELIGTIPKTRMRDGKLRRPRRKYRQDRRAMLEGWYPSGLDFLNIRAQDPQGDALGPSGVTRALPTGSVLITRGQLSGLAGVAEDPLRKGLVGSGVMEIPANANGRRRYLSHEMGHILGLGHHPSDPRSVMYEGGYTKADRPSPGDVAATIGPDVGLPDPGDLGYRAPRPPPAKRRRRTSR